MGKGSPLTTNQRDIMSALYIDGNKDAKSIAALLGITEHPVYTQMRIEELVRADSIVEAVEYAQMKRAPATLEWALKKYNKTMPAEPATTAEEETNKPAEAKVIDKDQMARIMFALGKLTEQMENLNTKMEKLIEVVNANADNSYRLLADTKGAMVEGLRKARRM